MYPRLVVFVLGFEPGLQVVDERGGGRHQLADHVVAGHQQAGAGVRGGEAVGGGRRGGEGPAPLAPLGYLSLDVERASLGTATVVIGSSIFSAARFIDSLYVRLRRFVLNWL